jgi:hypothetical protein
MATKQKTVTPEKIKVESLQPNRRLHTLPKGVKTYKNLQKLVFKKNEQKEVDPELIRSYLQVDENDNFKKDTNGKHIFKTDWALQFKVV